MEGQNRNRTRGRPPQYLMLESDVEEARRKERNRESAKRSRELARQHVTMLEQNVALLAHDSQALLNRLAHVEAENAYLRQVHQQLIRQSVTENAAANAPSTKNPGEVGDDEPAALMSQSLQRMPTLLLLLLPTAEQCSCCLCRALWSHAPPF